MRGPCMFDDRDPIKIFRFLDQFKGPVHSNEVSEVMAQWTITNFMKKDSRVILNNLIVRIEVSCDAYAWWRVPPSTTHNT